MTSSKQFIFTGFEKLKVKDFGGSLNKGNPRDSRPISTKRPMHLVMRSTLARGEKSFLRPARAKHIKNLVQRLAQGNGVKVYRFANSGNHLHMIVLPKSRDGFNAFIRAISGLIARITLGVERGRALGLKFWDARPFTRILEWGKDYTHACRYLLQNTLEALGFIPYRSRVSKVNKSKSRTIKPQAPPK